MTVMSEPQNFKNHGRFVPIYHAGVFFPFLLNFFWAVYHLWRVGVHGESIITLLMSMAFLLLFGSVRGQILTVQDRVIRLEMQLRLARVLPPDMHSQISQLGVKQLVALRFASDAELQALVREVVAGKHPTTKEIKIQVKDWQADHQRA
jgi:hypothetical protein